MNKLRFLMVTLSLLLFSAKKAEAASSYIQKVLFDISAEIADSANYHLRIPQWRYGEHSGNVSIWKGQLDALGAPSANRRLVYRMSFAPAGGGNIPQGQWEQYNLTFSLNLPVIPNNAPVGTVVQGTPVAWTRATGSLNAYNWFKVSILARKKGPSPSEVEYFASVYGYNHTTQDDQEQDKLIDIPSYFPIGDQHARFLPRSSWRIKSVRCRSPASDSYIFTHSRASPSTPIRYRFPHFEGRATTTVFGGNRKPFLRLS